jgi:hypothetical protein
MSAKSPAGLFGRTSRPPLHDLELYLQLVWVALEGLKLLADLIQPGQRGAAGAAR